MKVSQLKNKRVLGIAALAIVAAAVGATIAYNADSMNFANKFTLTDDKAVFTEVFESPANWQPCQEISKTATATNPNNTARYVRVKYTEYWRKANSAISDDNHTTTELPLTWTESGTTNRYAVINFQNQSDWLDGGDGWYYYKNALAKDATTSSLFKSVTMNCNANVAGTVTYSADGKSGESTPTEYAGAKYHLYITFEMSSQKYAALSE